MVKVKIALLMGINTKVNMFTESQMDTVSINGVTVMYIKENFKRDRDVGKENGKNRLMKSIAINLKECIATIRKMAKVSLNGKMEQYIKETTRTIKDMAMAKCIGQMAQFIKANGKMVVNT